MYKSFGKVKVKKISPVLADIPEDCGYEKQFEGPQTDNPYDHRWEEQNSYMSFEKRLDATRFWLSVGVENMGNNKGAYVK